METLNWDLSVLSKAVAYNNLSGASSHVGLSQPQLSRIVAKLEDQFAVTLLDRDAKRKSSWTAAAFRLAEIYSKTVRQFNGDIQGLVENAQPKQLRFGALEGLAPLAADCAHHTYMNSNIKLIELHVFDLSELEENFFKGELDFMFTSRSPGRKKFKHSLILGHQTLDEIQRESKENLHYAVLSPFQYAPKHHEVSDDDDHRTLVSNSLYVRHQWIDRFGGHGVVPSDVRSKRSGKRNEEPVLLLGQEHFPAQVWDLVSSFRNIKP